MLLLFLPCLQTLEFFNYFFESARVGQGVYRSILETPRDLLLGMVVPPSEWLPYNYGAEQQVSPFISIPIICFGFAGTVLALRQKDKDSAITILLLGVLPTTAAYILYLFSDLRLQLPLVKNGDILRVLWFSFPFYLVAVGLF